MATTKDVNSIIYAGDMRVDSLLTDGVQWNYLTPFRDTLFYSFDLSLDVVGAADSQTTVVAFSASQKVAAKTLMNYVSALTGIKLVEVASGATADIHFANDDLLSSPTTMGVCVQMVQDSFDSQGNLITYTPQAYVYLDNKEFKAENADLTLGGEGFETLLHEVGHAFGLGHPFDSTAHALPVSQDNTNNTVMSYTVAGAYKSTFQNNDLLALAWLYGNDGLGGTYGLNSASGPTLNPPSGIAASRLGTSGNDTLVGTAGNDMLAGLGGSDTLNGGGGLNTAVYNGKRANYTVSQNGATLIVADKTGVEGTDTLLNIQRLHFTDQALAFDISGNAGECYRIYQAAFNRTPDSAGLGYWIEAMDLGASLADVATGFIGSSEFAGVYGSNQTSADLVTRFYQNVLHRMGDALGLDYWTTELSAHHKTVAQVLASFSESPEYQAQLLATIREGIAYIPFG